MQNYPTNDDTTPQLRQMAEDKLKNYKPQTKHHAFPAFISRTLYTPQTSPTEEKNTLSATGKYVITLAKSNKFFTLSTKPLTNQSTNHR